MCIFKIKIPFIKKVMCHQFKISKGKTIISVSAEELKVLYLTVFVVLNLRKLCILHIYVYASFGQCRFLAVDMIHFLQAGINSFLSYRK